jgi:hypothetical protein
VAGSLRLLVAAGGGWLALQAFGPRADALFAAMALALVVLGTTVATALRLGAWDADRRLHPRMETPHADPAWPDTAGAAGRRLLPTGRRRLKALQPRGSRDG